MDTKITGAIGAGVGALQTPVIRQFVDRAYPTTNVPFLKGFGTPSSLVGTVGGGIALAAGAIGTTKGKDGRPRLSDNVVVPAIDYGIVALIGGIFSGLYPAVTEADCVAKGGYFYDGVCHKEPAAAMSMQNQPGIQTATSYTYKPPAIASQSYIPPARTQSPAVDMNVLKQMSAEIQRLSQAVQSLNQENAALRTQAHVPAIMVEPGQVTSKQRKYGFMEGVETSAQPLRKVQQIRKKFDFMG
uniref:Uncharacterized protein n=1 Tax=viral metagenome TaxID=1070528 RepID=A0A6M3MAG0_9ZZZZ